MQFLSDLKYYVRSCHVTDGVTTIRLSWTLLPCEVVLTSQSLLLFALNCHSYRLLTTPLGNAPVQSHLTFQMPDVNWQLINIIIIDLSGERIHTYTHNPNNRKLLMQTPKISTSLNKSRKIGLHQTKKYHKGKTVNKSTQLRNSSPYNTTTKPSYSNSPWQCTDIFVIKRHFS